MLNLFQPCTQYFLLISISTADGYEQMTIMTPEKVLPSIVQLINQYSFANSSRYVRIIKVEKVTFDAKCQKRKIL